MIKNRHSACSILLLPFHSFLRFFPLFKGGEKDLCANLLTNVLLISDNISIKVLEISYIRIVEASTTLYRDNYPEAREISSYISCRKSFYAIGYMDRVYMSALINSLSLDLLYNILEKECRAPKSRDPGTETFPEFRFWIVPISRW